ncbi:MAG: ferrous iron transport protein A [Clostridia bacterium]|nr:ferrous iron transport protein A [Clostridia bacterium]
MTLIEAQEGKEYIIKSIEIEDDEELVSFLFSLGCYSGEAITVVAHKKNSLMVSIKDARYNIDSQLAESIII